MSSPFSLPESALLAWAGVRVGPIRGLFDEPIVRIIVLTDARRARFAVPVVTHVVHPTAVVVHRPVQPKIMVHANFARVPFCFRIFYRMEHFPLELGTEKIHHRPAICHKTAAIPWLQIAPAPLCAVESPPIYWTLLQVLPVRSLADRLLADIHAIWASVPHVGAFLLN